MDAFTYRGDELYCEEMSLRQLADTLGTPLYVYSRHSLIAAFSAYQRAFASIPHIICYAMKANSNLGVMATLAGVGAGADVISGGELFRALRAGIDPKKIVFAGVGKSREEMRDALKSEILMFNVESDTELRHLDGVAQEMGLRAPMALRVNPDVDPQTHPYISTGLKGSKFGIPIGRALAGYEAAARMKGIEVVGVHMHIGSQITKTAPFADAIARVVDLIGRLRRSGIQIRFLDAGGGLGIRYKDEEPPSKEAYAKALLPLVRELGVSLILEPGRSIVGDAGVLLTRVLFIKEGETKSFVVVDAAMNDLIRPSLYSSYHEIRPVHRHPAAVTAVVDVVGPVCESGDFLATERELPRVREGDLLAVMNAGAYGFAMASNYNSRPRAAEVLVARESYSVVRRRESYEDLIAGESPPEFRQGGPA